jgi:hypothetical protein
VILGGKIYISHIKEKIGEKKTRKKKVQNFPICPRDFPEKKPHP